MQRQSLGSPVSKLHNQVGGSKDDAVAAEDDKAAKTRRLSQTLSSSPSSSPPKPEKLVHLIPLLTFFCFFVLYLVSHAPSQSDLAQFNGFKPPSKHIDSKEVSEVDPLTELRRGDVLAIGSFRNLQEMADKPSCRKFRPHRKTADC
uniref:Uncharacterized protein n=1 Tax=Rhizophora mucronata TaxID=61149 RepID=A0A2P2L4T5_RHIMU